MFKFCVAISKTATKVLKCKKIALFLMRIFRNFVKIP